MTGTGRMNVRVHPLRLGSRELDDLAARLRVVRWPTPPVRQPWEDGVDAQLVRGLVEHWRTGFDWREREAALNRFEHVWTDIDGLSVHAMIAPSGTSGDDVPVLALHGWPSTFEVMSRLADTLSSTHAVTVVAPSLPGFGFSTAPTEPGWGPQRIARALHTFMSVRLGYRRYLVRGTDYGIAVALHLGNLYPGYVTGVHIGGTHMQAPGDSELPTDLTDREAGFVRSARRWYRDEAAYNELHASKPETLAYALSDSPAGLLAWIAEKHRTWCATPHDVTESFTFDDMLSTATIYWATNTMASSIRLYREDRLAGPSPRSFAPVAVSQPELEEYSIPESWWARNQPVHRYTHLPDAGHFPDWENPIELADDIAAFRNHTR